MNLSWCNIRLDKEQESVILSALSATIIPLLRDFLVRVDKILFSDVNSF